MSAKTLFLRSWLATAVLLFGISGVCFAQGPPRPTTRAVPEIDPATATTALALLAGGTLVIRGRRRR
jgi:hypothetical protein